MLKRLALVGGAVAGIVFLRRKAQQQQAEQDLWTAATDDVSAPATPVTTPDTPVSHDEATTSS